MTEAVRGVAGQGGLVVILDDIHVGDEPSLLVLRHLAEQITDAKLLVFAAFRDVEAARVLAGVLPDLLRSPRVERLDLRGFGLAEVREQLSGMAVEEADARAVLDVTGGNPLFVREVARAMAEGTWRPDRPPRTVLDVVGARLDSVSAGCRKLVQAAAIVGRDFSVALVAAALDEPAARCLPLIDEAMGYGLLDRVGDHGGYRFTHALTRDAVEASLATADRVALHRRVAEAIQAQFAGDLSEHLGDLARHWAELAPYGEAATARTWAIRAAAEAVRRLAYEEGVRLYRAALALDPASLPDAERAGYRSRSAGRPTSPATCAVAWMPQLRRRMRRARPGIPSSWPRPPWSSRRLPTLASTRSPNSCARRRSPASARDPRGAAGTAAGAA